MNAEDLNRSHIYFAKAESTGLIKVGRTMTLRSRLNNLSCLEGTRMVLVASWPCPKRGPDAYFERVAFAALKDKHSHGEWFQASNDDIATAITALDVAKRHRIPEDRTEWPAIPGREKQRADKAADRNGSSVRSTKIRLDGRNLVRLRASRDWTQEQAAKNASVSLPTYGNAERGLEIQAAKAGKIARSYGVSVEELELVAAASPSRIELN